MNAYRRWWCAALVLVSAGMWAVWAQAQEAPKFRFNPGDGLVTIRESKTTQTAQAAGRPPHARVNTIREKAVYTRARDGYGVRSTLLSATTIPASGDALMSAMKGKTLTMRLAKDATVRAIDGLETFAAEARKQVPAQAAGVVTTEVLFSRVKAQWEGDTTDYLGHRARVGEAWVSRQLEVLPDGRTQPCYVAKKVGGRARTQGRDCLRVLTMTHWDPRQLRGFLGSKGDALLAGLKPLTGGAKVTGQSYRVVDPATLVEYSGKGTLRMEMTISTPDGGTIPMTFTQVKQATTRVQTPGK